MRASLAASRADWRWLLAGAWLLGGAGPPECVVTLTRIAPRATCNVPNGQPVTARLPVRALDNPGQGPVDMRIGLVRAGKEVALQSVSLYPVDRPAVFALRLPPAPGPASLVLTLPAGSSPLAVRVGPVTYQYAEPR